MRGSAAAAAFRAIAAGDGKVAHDVLDLTRPRQKRVALARRGLRNLLIPAGIMPRDIAACAPRRLEMPSLDARAFGSKAGMIEHGVDPGGAARGGDILAWPCAPTAPDARRRKSRLASTACWRPEEPLMRRGPVRAEPGLDRQRHIQSDGGFCRFLHHRLHQLCRRLRFVLGDFEQQFVMNLQKHSPPQPRF